jgi:hypothetical protein
VSRRSESRKYCAWMRWDWAYEVYIPDRAARAARRQESVGGVGQGMSAEMPRWGVPN